MLVLSRKQGERLVVGEDITITITKCGRNRVVIGIDAPKEMPVKRAELSESDFLDVRCDRDGLKRNLSVA